MILISLGANLPSAEHGPPRATLEAALAALGRAGARVVRCSRWYRSAPLPRSAQPWFVNGVAALETALGPPDLLELLHRVERDLGRRRGVRWAPRVADIDLLVHGDVIVGPGEDAGGLVLPHPRLHERAFVLLPLAELAPAWRHPVLGKTPDELIAALPEGQIAEPLVEEAEGA